jgi:hypothetical protein
MGINLELNPQEIRLYCAIIILTSRRKTEIIYILQDSLRNSIIAKVLESSTLEILLSVSDFPLGVSTAVTDC